MKIAYLSHVSSRWIKQRPHFLSEALGRIDGFEVTFLDSLLVNRQQLVQKQRLSIPVWHLPLMPQRYRGKLRAVDCVLDVVSALLIYTFVRADVLVVTHARHALIARVLKRLRVRIIYDCMDLNREFADATQVDIEAEKWLVESARYVWCSSWAISQDIRKRHPSAHIRIVRNALDLASAGKIVEAPSEVERGTVRYIGTISSWFRFEDVLALLDARPDVHVELIGPSDVVIPEHPRLIATGPLAHGKVMARMAASDVLIMPFEITPLILGVDPVKVYEYIACGRPVVCSDYPELAHFGSSIARSATAASFVQEVCGKLGTPRRSKAEVLRFLQENNWEARAVSVVEDLCAK